MEFYIKLLVSIVLAVLGWWGAHYLASLRDLRNKKRELIVQYLVEAYRRLEQSGNRDNENKEHISNIESALADIQLFGTQEQVNLASHFMDRINSYDGASMNDLLLSLRDSLRKELGLDELSNEMKFLRLDSTKRVCVVCTKKVAPTNGRTCIKGHFICSKCDFGPRSYEASRNECPICKSEYK